MLTKKELLFVEYWKANRLKEGKIAWQLLRGLPVGLLFSMPIFIIVFTSRYWYKRADMVAVSRLNPLVLAVAVTLIACFIAVFYKRQQWDRKEQQFLELQYRVNDQKQDPV